MNTMTLSELARLSSQALYVVRDATFENLGTIQQNRPKMLVFLESDQFLNDLLNNPSVVAVITTSELAPRLPEKYGLATAENARSTFYRVHNALAAETSFYWEDFPTEISEDAIVHPEAYVAPRNVRVGAGTVIEPGVTVLGNSFIGEDVILRSGCVIGAEGFEFKRLGDEILGVAHAGGVKLGNRVEIQSNTVVDRAVFGDFTEIGDDTKIDNLVHVAHSVHIGKRCLIIAHAMLGGSCTIGNDVWIGPSANISNGLKIGDRARITMGSIVTREVEVGRHVTGNFAIDHHKFISFIKSIR